MIVRLILSLGLIANFVLLPATAVANDEEAPPSPSGCFTDENGLIACYGEALPLLGCETPSFDPSRQASPTDPLPCPVPAGDSCVADEIVVVGQALVCRSMIAGCAISSDGTSTCVDLPALDLVDRPAIDALYGAGGRVIRDIGGALFIENGRLSVWVGCNTMGAEVTTTGDRLTVGPIFSTMMWCPDDAEIEWLITTILEGENLTWVGDQELASDAGRITLTRPCGDCTTETTVPANDDLSTWPPIASITVDGTAFTVDGGYLAITDGQLSASVGCNRIGGAVTIDGDRLELRDLIATEMYCEALAEAESALLAILAGDDLTWATEFELRSSRGSILIASLCGDCMSPTHEGRSTGGGLLLGALLLLLPAFAGLGAVAVGLSTRE
jgi:heat shock protein HslJ